MRDRLAVVAVVALVVLAGCSGGGGSSTQTEGGSTPTETPAGVDTPMATPSGETPTNGTAAGTPTATPVTGQTPTATPTDTDAPTATPTATLADETPTATPAGSSDGPPGYSDGAIYNRTRFGQAYLPHIAAGPVSFNMTLRNTTADASQKIRFTLVNDTEETLVTLNNLEQSGTTTYFIQNGTDATRNTTSGEIRYAQGENNNIEFAAGFLQIFALLPSAYFSAMEWEQTDTRTIDGDTYYVFDSNSMNQTALDQSDWETNGNFRTASGHVVMRSDGFVREGWLRLSGTTASGTEVDVEVTMSMRGGSDISVEKPDWYDESDAETAN